MVFRSRKRELDLQKRERALYAREAVANAGLDKNLADEFVGMDKETVDKCLKIIAPYAQKMKEPFLNAVGPTNGGDTIASDEDLERDAIRRIDHEHMKRELWLAVDQLPDRLPAAIRLRYESGLTYKEMGERLGVDMNQARSLEQKAFKKLRIPSRAKRFRAYHEEYLSASQIHHVGVRRFNETWTSEVEGDAIRWTEKERGC